jgi:hypothetical protein
VPPTPVALTWTSMTTMNSALQEARDSRAASDDALLTRARAEHGDAKAIARTLGELSRAGAIA